jgi:hypothetical protein
MDYFSDSMDRVRRLFIVAKGFAAKGVAWATEAVRLVAASAYPDLSTGRSAG